jgi:lysophospholipase L1-like esterase
MRRTLLAAAAALLPALAQAASPPAWSTSWFASMVAVTPGTPGQYEGQTIRAITHLSVGGMAVRVRISNEWGTGLLKIGAAHIAASTGNSRTRPGTNQRLTFSGAHQISIPQGATAISDPVVMDVPAETNLAVSLYLLKTDTISDHQGANQTSYVADGDQTDATSLPDASKISDRPFITGIDVMQPAGAAAASVITLGDSITDGTGSDFNQNDRWPDLLGERLVAAYGNGTGVGNAGIGGNALISRPAPTNPVATARFNQDVLAQPGRRWVILLEGINDIGNTLCCGSSPDANQLIGADRQILAAAHALGLKVYGMTLLPYKGAVYYTDAGEQKRETLNDFIRNSGEFDAVFDTDKALQDPANPLQLNPAYDSGDHLHPNEAGHAAIANTVDIKLLSPARTK